MKDAGFFLGLAEHNLSRGDDRAALTCLRSALGRRNVDPARAAGLLEQLRQRGALGAEELAEVAERLEAGEEPPREDPALEAVRRLLVSPDLVERLREVVGGSPARSGPLELPVADVVARLLEEELDLAATARLALDLLVAATGADDGNLILADAGRTSFGLEGAARPAGASLGVLQRVEQSRRTVLIEDATRDPSLGARESVRRLSLRSVLCVPLLLGEELRYGGAIYLAASRSAGRFGARERDLAESLAAMVAPALEGARRRSDASRARVAGLRPRRAAAPALLGESSAARSLRERIGALAVAEQPVLILGESGTGKELVARALHAQSPRRRGPFVAENMSALPEGLVEAALFGHARGAFTGAHSDAPGLFRLAEGGVLLLDEVAEMPLGTQAKLLRVLQEGEVRPVGARATLRVDVRVIAATHRDLAQRVEEGAFREDLYYRLRVLELSVPPLRERGEDLLLLLERFVAEEAARHGLAAPELDEALQRRVRAHPWPGNVRELKAFAARLVLVGPQAAFVAAPQGVRAEAAEGGLRVDVSLPADPPGLREARREFERAYIGAALARCGGSVQDAAKLLGLNRSYLSELITRHELR